MTSEDLITKLTQPFTLMPSSSTASLVIEDVRIFPPMSTQTCEVVAPFLTSTTIPLMWLRAPGIPRHAEKRAAANQEAG
jgi:hypothetical protein